MEPLSFELTLEQQFEIRRLQHEAALMDRDQAVHLLLQVAELLMVKDNLIKDLMKKAPI
jgi:Phycobilisome degradation protein nblA